MKKSDIYSKIKNILQNMLNLESLVLEKLTPETDLIVALNLTSIDAMQLLVLVEREFEIFIDDEDIGKELIQNIDTIANKIIQIKCEQKGNE
ncbi:MAG: hypothetical protein HFH11_10255 [Dorea sp.]|jgi:acyl carrier protein|nr:hypothetical protein [Clostridiales bacterium]MCI9271512.1 hypothetical protein [Dorea sp.]